MDMDSDTIQKMREKLLICSVCMDEYDDPRILPCHHTFCLDCIQSIVQSLPVNARTLSCPHCREDAIIPRNGVTKFPVNFYLSGLKEELGAAAQLGMCHVCGLVQVQFFCVDCDFNICRFCIAPHRLEHHQERSKVLRLSSGSSSHLLASNSCQIHMGEMLQLFCNTCQEAICITCSCSREHKRHNLIPMSERLQEIKARMQKELDKLIHELQQANKSISLIKSRKVTMVSSRNDSIFNLNQVAIKSCETIMRLKSKIENEIQSSTENQIARMNDIEIKLQAYLDLLNKGKDFLVDLQENDICIEALESFNKYSTSVQKARDCYTSTQCIIQQQSFIPSYDVKATNVKIGSLKTQLLYGNLGFTKSKYQNLSVSNKTLEVVAKPKKVFQLPSLSTSLKIGLFITSFFIFEYVLRQLDSNELYVNDFRAEISCVEEEISKACKKITVYGAQAFEDFFIPP